MIEDLKAIRSGVSEEREITRKLCELLGKTSPAELCEEVERLVLNPDKERMEERIAELSSQLVVLQIKLKRFEEGKERKLSPDSVVYCVIATVS